MNLRNRTRTLGPLGLSLVLACSAAAPWAHARDLRVQVLLRGPVHEAFAAPLLQQFLPPPIVPGEPPQPIDELLPLWRPAGFNVQWIPGYWAYDDAQGEFLWVTGLWRRVPPDKRWVPGNWVEVEGGWQRSPGFWADAGLEEMALVPQPPAVLDRTRTNLRAGIYVPAGWVFRNGRYQWRPGFWYTPRPGWCWSPDRYTWTPAGWAFVKGHWDYPLANRGLLFAPVSLDAEEIADRDDGTFRPGQVVNAPALLGGLFVRPAWGAYYFGNYFEPRYRAEFKPWLDYHPTLTADDPLLAYYRWQKRDDRRCLQDLQTLYKRRQSNKAFRPPVTPAEQAALIETAMAAGVQRMALQDVEVLTPLDELGKTAFKLERLSEARLGQEQKAVERLRTVAKERQRILAGLTRVPPVTRPMDKVRVRSMSLPGAGPAVRNPNGDQPPKLPRLPPAVTKTLPRQESVKPPLVGRPRTRPADLRVIGPNKPRPVPAKPKPERPRPVPPRPKVAPPAERPRPVPPRPKAVIPPKTGAKPPADGRPPRPMTKPPDPKKAKTGSGSRKP